MKFKIIATFITGLTIGALSIWLLIQNLAPRLVFSIHESKFSTVAETSTALQKSIEDHGWQPCQVRDFAASMREAGVPFEGSVELIELCNPAYAKQVLSESPELSAIMPCQWGVYQKEDGKVYITSINTQFIGQLFGGKIGKLLSQNVDIEEDWMLEGIIRP